MMSVAIRRCFNISHIMCLCKFDKRWRMFSKMFMMDMLLKMIIYAKVWGKVG